MKVLLYGASGLLGQRILAEAVERGHAVTAASTDPARVQELPGVTLVQSDVLDPSSVSSLATGHDAIVSAIGAGHADDPSFPCSLARSLLEAAQRSGTRVIVVGCSAEAGQAVQPIATLDFAATWSGTPQAEADAREVYRTAPEDVRWTYLVPEAPIRLGQQAGHLSPETVAATVLRELEQPRHLRQNVTISP